MFIILLYDLTTSFSDIVSFWAQCMQGVGWVTQLALKKRRVPNIKGQKYFASQRKDPATPPHYLLRIPEQFVSIFQ